MHTKLSHHFNIIAEQPQWVVWKYEPNPSGGKPKKKPFTSLDYPASTADPETWSTAFDLNGCIHQYDGIGLMLTDGLLGIDLDGCRDPETGAIE